MEENPMVVVVADMGSAALTDQPPSSWEEEEEGCELDKMGIQKISVSDETNNLKFSSSAIKSDSFVVDMDRFSHLADKDMPRITRTLSRKGQGRSTGEKKTNSTATSEKDSSISSPRSGGVINTLEKSMVVTMGAIDPPLSPHHNHHPHQITIVTSGNNNSTTTTSNNSENRLTGRKYSFKRSSPSNWSIDPRRILLFFATLSSMGTILLIYFTLSMGKLSGGGGDDAAAQ
ncbi:uncharacterized protein LOC124914887 isoform X2 [Impatiens glandulifera]|uniref:uncharacterized protein LOC124914887 isoform X2 n=1 Tax=Impatiens glandulifera TaxID=253017 RepID=UPI001FB175BE|nr:uncharacterized protein LOC124914887 isoform X2 [Impatiens glandulifera]